MGTFERDRPILLYSKVDDSPDVDPNFSGIVGIPDSEQVQEVRVVVSRPNGERWGILIPRRSESNELGNWWLAELNLSFTDDFGRYGIKWIFKTQSGEVTSEYSIDVLNNVLTPYWNFQMPRSNVKPDELPEDIKQKIGEKNAD